MKLFGILLFLLLTGCGQDNYNEDKVETERQITETSTQFEKHKDSLQFPDWLTNLYPSELKLKHQTIVQKLTDFRRVNDSVAYCTYKQMDGVCERHYLETFVHKKQRASLEIGYNCDHDLSIPTYTWKEFEVKSSNLILTNEYTESVHDSMINDNGRMKKAYSFLEAETTIDTARQVFQVDQKGMIVEIKE